MHFFRSTRGKISLAFTVLGLLTVAIGLYGYYGISAAGRIVVDTYDRPLMAINFARAASLSFSQMNNVVLHRQLSPPAEKAKFTEKLGEVTELFFEDLEIAAERALTERALNVVREIRKLVREWEALEARTRAGEGARLNLPLDALSDRIVEQFDILIELTAGAGFRERQKSVRAISDFETTGIIVTIFVILFSVVTTYFVSKRILKPLGAAISVARHIAAGDFEFKVPRGREDETGALLRSLHIMQGSLRDMIEREKAERESAQKRLADALESSHEAMVLVDENGKIVIASSQVAEIFPSAAPVLQKGAHLAEVLNQVSVGIQLTGPGEDGHEETVEEVCGLLYQGGDFRLKDGRWIRITRSATRDGGYFLFFADFTDIKEREEAYRKAKKEAEAANTAKSNFLANMSHELRTPLNAVIGFAEVLNGEMFGKLGHEKYLDYSADILHSGRHLLSIINNVLDLSKSESGMLTLSESDASLDSIIEGCLRIIGPEASEKTIELRYEHPEEPVLLRGDETKLAQIILNLLSNAVKFTEDGKPVALTVTEARSGWITIKVSDQGIGMREEDIEVALSPFGQVDSRLARKYEGTGLGLPLSKVLTEMHGGTLEVTSAPGEGTTVTVTLPNGELGSVEPEEDEKILVNG